MPRVKKRQTPDNAGEKIDLREQLFNEGLVGPIEKVQVSTERIAALRGILFDLDPALLRRESPLGEISGEPSELYETTVRRWLSRDPVLDKAEVRMSGTGLHVILWLDEPLLFTTDAERLRWAGIVEVVQAALPIDPRQPGITATTRPIGSINSKNNAVVERLKEGMSVSAAEAIELKERIVAGPFRTLMHVLTGSERLSPCPGCGLEGSALTARDYVGHCYVCGKVDREKLYALVMAPAR